MDALFMGGAFTAGGQGAFAATNSLLDLAGKLCHGGEDALFCFRCTGVWAGIALALPIVFFARRAVPIWLWLLLGAAFLQMPVLGYGRIPLPEEAKALSGQVFALSAVFGLALAPLRRRTAAANRASAGRPVLVIAAAGIAVLQILIRLDSPAARRILDALAIIGLAAAVLLVLLFLAALFPPRRRSGA